MSTDKVILSHEIHHIPHKWCDIPDFKKTSEIHTKQEKCMNCGCVKDTHVSAPPNMRPITNVKYSVGNLGVWNISPNCENKDNPWYSCPQNP